MIPVTTSRLAGRRGSGNLGLLLLFKLDRLIVVLALGVPLAGLQDEDADQDEGQDGIAGGQDAQAILAADDDVAEGGDVGHGALALGHGLVVDAVGDDAQALDDVGDVDDDADEVEHERGAVEQEVGFRRLE